ncbi:MAG: molybdopterin cofactor-binding domain-containing protein [Pseudonocardiaceae bacterium]
MTPSKPFASGSACWALTSRNARPARVTAGRHGPARVAAAQLCGGPAAIRLAVVKQGIGTGTRTVMTQLSAEVLGLELDQVRFDLGDSDMPWSPAAGGSAVGDRCARGLPGAHTEIPRHRRGRR